jgi:hypothetical protein
MRLPDHTIELLDELIENCRKVLKSRKISRVERMCGMLVDNFQPDLLELDGAVSRIGCLLAEKSPLKFKAQLESNGDEY